ncbi:MAG: U32 family peptidase [Bacilli bacterium]|nr:U32 family peptidase [Bacilli bacterium]
MYNKFKIGFIFNDEYINFIEKINNSSVHKIVEVYGSIRELSYLSARPKDRVPDISRDEFKKYLNKLKDISVDFNYTLNSTDIGSKEDIFKNTEEIKEFIKFLIDAGVKIFTISLPILAKFIREISSSVQIELSTIIKLESVSQITIWKKIFNISRVCMNISKNREILFLERAMDYCKKEDIDVNLIVNEFCGNGVDNICTTSGCIYRDHCYSLHSKDYTSNDSDNLDGYPFSYCSKLRNDELIWLKLNFIRPEDLKMYNKIGINFFKITGRTGTIQYMEKIVNAYMTQRWDGTLQELWFNQIYNSKKINIKNSNLEGFINYWFENKNHLCSNNVCGVTCKYCNSFFEKII